MAIIYVYYFHRLLQHHNSINVLYLDYQALHGANLNDVWGYVDEFGNEYAIVGTTIGTSVVDLSDPNNPTTTVSCSNFGLYELFYTDECGSVSSIEFNMQAVSPEIAEIPDVSCSFSSFLYLADSFSSQGFWSLVSAPNGETAFFENSNSENTIVTVSDYGTYTFAYNSCGSFDEVEIEFKKDPYANFAVT